MTDAPRPGDLALDARAGLPPDLRALLDRYPRETWDGHANLGQTARFWLGRHGMFRDLGTTLVEALAARREAVETGDGGDATPFVRFFAPRLQFFLRELDGHHHIEDHHYFPVFRAAEGTLARGFDLLDADHHVIHEAIERNAESANALLRALGRAGERAASERHAEETDRMIRLLVRHLDDEEDLIVPLILDRTEAALGIG